MQLAGELTGEALEQQWDAADLSLLVSKVEAFGMAVTESVARGVPVIVRAGTGAVEALGLGAETGQSIRKVRTRPARRRRRTRRRRDWAVKLPR